MLTTLEAVEEPVCCGVTLCKATRYDGEVILHTAPLNKIKGPMLYPIIV